MALELGGPCPLTHTLVLHGLRAGRAAAPSLTPHPKPHPHRHRSPLTFHPNPNPPPLTRQEARPRFLPGGPSLVGSRPALRGVGAAGECTVY
eukprot:scaffold64925_cov36-Phaeocystis_antarctica.AAC.1